MAWRGSLSRSLISAARSSPATTRSPPSLPRLRPATHPNARLSRRRLPLAPSRSFGELACAQSLLPLHSAVANARLTSHLSISARACCELSQGTFCRTCQDR